MALLGDSPTHGRRVVSALLVHPNEQLPVGGEKHQDPIHPRRDLAFGRRVEQLPAVWAEIRPFPIPDLLHQFRTVGAQAPHDAPRRSPANAGHPNINLAYLRRQKRRNHVVECNRTVDFPAASPNRPARQAADKDGLFGGNTLSRMYILHIFQRERPRAKAIANRPDPLLGSAPDAIGLASTGGIGPGRAMPISAWRRPG
jgi:hypothetical protein